MAKFCKKCGTPLNGNGICPKCNPQPAPQPAAPASQPAQPWNTQATGAPQAGQYYNPNPQQGAPSYGAVPPEQQTAPGSKMGFGMEMDSKHINISVDKEKAKNFWVAWKNRAGFGDPKTNNTSVYERGMQIVPENVPPTDCEEPVRQYRFAVLRSRALLKRAEARMQVTNKRLLIRAPGRILLRGRTCLQYDFNINEIGGVDVRKSYKFSLFNLIAAWIVAPFLAGIVLSLIMLLLFQNLDFDRFSSNINFFQKLMLLIFGVAGTVPFFLLHKKWLLKLAGLNVTSVCFFLNYLLNTEEFLWYQNQIEDGFFHTLWRGIMILLMVVTLVLALITLIVFIFIPDLKFQVKSQTGQVAMEISRTRMFHAARETVGYTEVLPTEDTEQAIREVNSIITDLNKLGDSAVSKWKQ